MADTLETILTARRQRLAETKDRWPLGEIDRMAKVAPPPRSFFNAVTREGRISIIAEMKRRSPSAGTIRPDFDPKNVGIAYERGGASALSVLTEYDFFGGDIQDLASAREAVSLPVLRKDFIFDPYQIVEARAYGADAVLLIADMLDAKRLAELAACASENGMDALVEVFTAQVLPAALNTGSKLIGINSRNLRTLEMVPDNVVTLSRLVPRDRKIVAESGIKTPEEVERLKGLRVSAALIGESVLKQADLEGAVRRLANAAVFA